MRERVVEGVAGGGEGEPLIACPPRLDVEVIRRGRSSDNYKGGGYIGITPADLVDTDLDRYSTALNYNQNFQRSHFCVNSYDNTSSYVISRSRSLR